MLFADSLILLACVLQSGAQASLEPKKTLSQFIHQSWQTERGLPENSVTAIAQTPDGYIWLGTESGLARFDGVRFRTFDKSSTPGLNGNSITALLADREGTLWIGTHDGGLARLRHGEFSRFELQKNLGNDSISCLYEDAQGLWIGTDGGGLGLFREDTYEFSGRLTDCRMTRSLPLPATCTGMCGSQPIAA